MNKIPDIYIPPMGLPMYWMNEQSGVLRAAVRAYFGWCVGQDDPPEAKTIELLRQYCEHFINAPCWQLPEFESEFAALRENVRNLKTPQDLRTWLGQALQIGLDPF